MGAPRVLAFERILVRRSIARFARATVKKTGRPNCFPGKGEAQKQKATGTSCTVACQFPEDGRWIASELCKEGIRDLDCH
jgi:hypothetical protein